MRNFYLVWLEWPEKCFRIDAEALRFLRELTGKREKGKGKREERKGKREEGRGNREKGKGKREKGMVVRARSEGEFLKLLPKATHVITWHFHKDWYSKAPNLKLVATPSAGRELVDYSAAPEGVTVHFGAYHGAIIAEAVIGFVFAWAHGFFRPELAAADLRGNTWVKTWPRALLGDKCSLVAGTKAVIVGYGRIGKAIGAKLEALGVEVEGFGRSNLEKLPQALKKAAWLILALPSDTGTDNFVDARLISKLPRNCVVINIGRGNAIDESSLVKALESGRIAGAYLDVFHNEPGPLFKVGSAGKGGILTLPKRKLPWNLVRMPHSSAFCGEYLKMCFEELKNDGLI